jgi:2-hydroxy-3-oxopropionate reductase
MHVAVIGIGVMGSALAGRLLDTGAAVHLYDPLAEKCAPLVQLGARLADSAGSAAAPAEFIITSLNSAEIVERAVFGPTGIAAAASSDKLLVDMSSIDPASTSSMAAKLLASTGMGWVDAPLSGGAHAAAKGALTLMLGGSDADVARAAPLLSRLAARYTHFGAPGAGQTVKLINQVLCASAFLAVAEAVRFAEAHGVDATRVPEALAGGRADSRILQEFMAKMARRDFSPTGRIDNMLTDLETVQRAALARRVAMPVTSLIADLHRMLVAAGLGPADSAEYMRLFDLAVHREQQPAHGDNS